ncbi:MAG TPA: protein kinase, partial [Burkholderiaceae bacterium]
MSTPFPVTPAANELPTPPRALLRGTQVERFEILRVLADAASNIEYVALDQTERIEVVLKEYMPQRLGRRKGDALRPLTPGAAIPLAAGLRSFIDEGRMLASIDHPALVRVLGMIEANGTAYMVMPLYDGLRLQHARQSMSVPPDERLLRPLIDGLLSALEAMHAREMLHGAVSPGNILLLSDERAVLLGPDLARLVIADDLVESLMTAVEPSFEAPEQLTPSASKPLGPWTDLYSLAETIRFCIGGELRPPYVVPGGQRETMARMVQRLFGQPPTAVYAPALLETLDAALDPYASARPQSAARFRELLGVLPVETEAPPALAPMPGPPHADALAPL